MVRIYRWIIAFLLVFFIGFGVWYVAFTINEQSSTIDGTLVLEEIEHETDSLY